MNRFRTTSLALVLSGIALLASGAAQTPKPSQPGPDAPKKQLYTCPMHPMVVQVHPGRCPICGMNLVPVKPGTAKAANPSCGSSGGGCCGGETPRKGV